MVKLKKNKFLSILIGSIAVNFVAGMDNVAPGEQVRPHLPRRSAGQRSRHELQRQQYLQERKVATSLTEEQNTYFELIGPIYKIPHDFIDLIKEKAAELPNRDAQVQPIFVLMKAVGDKAEKLRPDSERGRIRAARSDVQGDVGALVFKDLDQRCKWLVGTLHLAAKKVMGQTMRQHNLHLDLAVFQQKVNAFQGISLEADTLPELNANFKASMEAALACIAYLANPEQPAAHTITIDVGADQLFALIHNPPTGDAGPGLGMPGNIGAIEIREHRIQQSSREFIGSITNVVYKFMQLVQEKLAHLAPLDRDAEAQIILNLVGEVSAEMYRFSSPNYKGMIELKVQNDTTPLTLIHFKCELLLGGLNFAAHKAFETMEEQQNPNFDLSVFNQKIHELQGAQLAAGTLTDLNQNFRAAMGKVLACILYLNNPQAADLEGQGDDRAFELNALD